MIMENIIKNEIEKECKIFNFKAENITIESKEVNNFNFVAVHYNMNTSKSMHRYILLCIKNNQIIYKSANTIDKSYFHTVDSCIVNCKNYFKSMSAKFNKIAV